MTLSMSGNLPKKAHRMDFKDLISLYYERSTALQTFWSFYVTIILGLLAFFGSLKPSRQKRSLAIALSIAFIAFASVNLAGIEEVTAARLAVRDLLVSEQKSHPILEPLVRTVKPPERWEVAAMHITGDLILLIGIWVLTLRKEDGFVP
jgi:hypothetical protein